MAKASLRLWLAAVLALLAAALVVMPAQAHGKRVRSDPADGAVLAEAPSQFRLWFTESIDGEFSTFQLADKNDRDVEVSSIRVDPADDTLLVGALPGLSSGVYTVSWRVLTPDDGHVTEGTVVFGIGAGVKVTAAPAADSATVPLPEVSLRWLHFGLMAAVVGSLAVVYLVLVPGGGPAAGREAMLRARRRTLGLAVLAGGAGLAVGLAMLLEQATALADGSLAEAISGGVWWRLLTETRSGALWLAREGALLGLILAVLLMRRGVRHAGTAAIALVPALVTTQALNSHAAALTEDRLPAIASDALHLLAAGVWVGGLLALIVAFLPFRARTDPEEEAAARASWRRFGVLAALSLGTLLVTGLYSVARQVASLDALLTTMYGQAIVGKAGLVLAAGALGLLNALLLHPRLASPLARALRRPAGWTPLAPRHLGALVMAEGALGVLVFLAAGLITSVAPARGPEFEPTAAAPSYLSQPVDDLVLTLSARPNKPGENIFTVGVLNTRRPAPADTLGVTLRFTSLDGGEDSVSAEAAAEGPGQYRLTGDYLARAGPWRIEVVAKRSGMADSAARFDWTVPPLALEVPPRSVFISNSPLREPLTAAAAATAAVLAVLAVAAWVVGRPSLRSSPGGGAEGEPPGAEAWKRAT